MSGIQRGFVAVIHEMNGYETGGIDGRENARAIPLRIRDDPSRDILAWGIEKITVMETSQVSTY